MAKKAGAAKSSAAKKVTPPKTSAALRILVVEARYYDHIADALLRGAMKVLDEAGCVVERLTVPGALEVPGAIAMATSARKKQPYDGVVALGCVIQGETYHFELVSNESARALMELSVDLQLPLGNGILTVDTDEQAKARLGGNHGHKGEQAARAALHMAQLKRELKGR
jgi:6,7-dimethyl-8-ribityllumazine synthase